MSLVNDFSIILKSLTIIGIPFSTFKEASTKRKLFLFITEIIFLLFALYFAIVGLIRHSPNKYVTYTLTSASVHVILLALRLTISYKRNKIMELIEGISYFSTSICAIKYRSQRRQIFCICFSCFLYTISMHILTLFTLALQPDGGVKLTAAYLFPTYTNLDQYTFISLTSIFQAVYNLVFHCTPGLVFVLVGFILTCISNALKNCVDSMSVSLKDQRMTFSETANCIKLLHGFITLFIKMEETISFIIFLTYAYALISQLNLITLFLEARYTVSTEITQVYIIMTFLVSFIGMCTVTFLATSMENRKSDLRKVIDNTWKKFSTRPQNIMYLLLLKQCDNADFSLTGWGMFKLNKSVLITISGFVVTYGYILLQLSNAA